MNFPSICRLISFGWILLPLSLLAVDESAEPLSPTEAAQTMRVPPGFHVQLFAGEPDVRQPISFCIDDRGRLWVAEAYNYPQHGSRPGDRILILEDVDGDGRFDNRTVFYDELNYVTGIEVGFGGAWVMSPPNMYFIPDRNQDDQPDSAPTVLLDGFGTHANSHNLANAFAWGPDGWLYGTHGRTNWSVIGKPGTRESERVRFDGGVYRYHPVRHVWEPFADGTTNPWSIDWDDFGQGFICNCVDPHLYFVIQGAHYDPWRNRESSQFAYQRIATIADHLHFVGNANIQEALGTPEEDHAGGGHAHCGTLIYLGDNWPAKYRNTVFMNNIHGRRINNDILKRQGSGYAASHGPDLMRSQDPWFMGVTLQLGPDGSVFVSDWSDTGECHSVRNTRRETGRIYKISYGDPGRRLAKVNIASLSNLELVSLQLHKNDWHVRHARRVLHERASRGQDVADAAAELRRLVKQPLPIEQRLRVIWAMHCLGLTSNTFLESLLNDFSEYTRAWAIRLMAEDRQLDAHDMSRFLELARNDSSAFVVLHLASVLQRLSLTDRWSLAEALISRSEFNDDANIPLMVWYGVEPLVETDVQRFAELSRTSRLALVRQFVARRIASLRKPDLGLELLVGKLGTADLSRTRDVLQGILTGLEGVRTSTMPGSWPSQYARLSASNDSTIRELSTRLGLIFDDPEVLKYLLAVAQDGKRSARERRQALESLIAKKAAGTELVLLQQLRHPELGRMALRGLAEFRHPDTAGKILDIYTDLDGEARQDAVLTLASRAAWANRLLAEIERGTIPRTDLTAFAVRQLHSLGDQAIRERVEAVWGQVRPTAADKEKLIAQYKSRLTSDALKQSNRSAGRTVYEKACANCHKLFDAGGSIGPNLTGSQRNSIDYLLENIVDPSAAIVKDFQMQVISTEAGRVISGLVVEENLNAVSIQTTTEKVVVPQSEIATRTTADVSMMPDRLLQDLSTKQLRDLFAYLTGEMQVPREAHTSPAPQ